MTVDAVTLEVVRNACVAVAEEMNATLIRTSYSPNIKDRRDCSCSLFDVVSAGSAVRPEMISQAENQPVHLGAMPYSVRAAVDRFPVNELHSGDAILVNDPFFGGAHLPDLTLISPLFVDDELVAFAANRAHHADVGGGHAGSVSAASTEIFQEGLRIPPVKLFEQGEVNEGMMELILMNVRTPEERRGDIRAQHAANETAQSRFLSLVDRYGQEELIEIMREVKAYSERRMRSELEALPDGEYSFGDVLDGDGHGTEDIQIQVTVRIAGGEVALDFSGTSSQVAGPVNAPFAVTASASYYAIRCVTDPDIPPNHGCYRPVTIDAPSGSVVNAESPAAVVGGNIETSQRITDVVLGAFGEVVSDRVMGAGQGTMNNITFGGTDPRDGSPYAFYETIGGGFGGRSGQDGMDGVHVHMSNTFNTPVEVLETAYPVRVLRYAYRCDSGGAGRSRGGLGLRRDIEVVGHTAQFNVLADRRHHGPYGVEGGDSGACGADFVRRDGSWEPIPGKSSHLLCDGSVVSIRTPGGGGFGDPSERDSAMVMRDVELGKVSPEAARSVYGVDCGPDP